nr:hypothetical protein [Tanacetum cinerariifolium]
MSTVSPIRVTPPRRKNCRNETREVDPPFAATVQLAVRALLPELTVEITACMNNENNANKGNNANRRNGRHDGNGNGGMYFPRSKQEKYEWEYKSIRQRDGETTTEFVTRFVKLAGFLGAKAGTPKQQAKNFKWALIDIARDKLVNMESSDVAEAANAARNIEILQKEMLASTTNENKREPEKMNKMRMSHARGNKGIIIGISGAKLLNIATGETVTQGVLMPHILILLQLLNVIHVGNVTVQTYVTKLSGGVIIVAQSNRLRGEHTLWLCQGVHQGDPLGLLLFALVLHPLICKIRDTFTLSLQAWYLDDGTIAGYTFVVGKVLELIIEDGPRVDFDFCIQLVMKRVDKTITLIDVVAKINDPQCEFLLLRSCMGIFKLYFSMRVCSPRDFETAKRSFDMALCFSLERIVTASGLGFGDWQWRLATLPYPFGGLGVYSVGDVLNYAFLASRLQSAGLQKASSVYEYCSLHA